MVMERRIGQGIIQYLEYRGVSTNPWGSLPLPFPFPLSLYSFKQEAQLSQRGRAMLHVVEYFAQSFKVIRSDNLE